MKKAVGLIAVFVMLCTSASCSENTAREQNIGITELGITTERNNSAAQQSGEASTSKDGKETDISLIQNAAIQLGKTAWRKGEIINFSIKSEEEQSIEVGFISTSSKLITSEVVKTGNGTFNLTVPEDDEYSLYCKNNTSSNVKFRVTIDRPMDKPGI